MDNGTKKPYLSKTIILNTLMALLGAVAVFWPNANFATAWITANGAILGICWSAANILLRLVTKNAISLED